MTCGRFVKKKIDEWEIIKQFYYLLHFLGFSPFMPNPSPGPEVINFFMLNSTEHIISTAHKNKNTDK